MILKLNEEQQGLKLIQVNDGFVVVDFTQQLKVKDLVVKTKSDGSVYELDSFGLHLHLAGSSGDGYAKIIFATPNLNLEGVPVIEEKELTENISNLGEYETNLRILKHKTPIQVARQYYEGFIEGYKQAQQNLYSREQIIEMFTWMNKNYSKTEDELAKPYEDEEKDFPDDFFLTAYNEALNRAFKYVKQQKVEITFEDGKAIKCVMV